MKQNPLSQFHKPALYTFAGTAAGILVSEHFFDEHTVIARISLYAFLALLLFAFFLFRGKVSIKKDTITILVAVFLGITIHSSLESLYELSALNKLSRSLKGESVVYGKVDRRLDESAFSTLFTVVVDSVKNSDVIFPVGGTLAVYIPKPSRQDHFALPNSGDALVLYGELTALEKKRNPYQIDFSEKLRREHHVEAALYLRTRYDYNIATTFGYTDISTLEKVREYVSDVLSASIRDTETARFVEAVLIGAGNTLPPETWQEFNRAGLTHILVVSGFNLGLVALFFYYLLRLLRLRSRILRSSITLIVVIGYLLVIGNQPSILRATIVVIVFLVARMFERKTDLVNITAAAACINLIINPYELFNIGFQLSYAAVFSLATIAPQFDRLFLSRIEQSSFFKRAAEIGLRTLFGTVSVFLGTLPILIYHYQQVSVVGLFTNILIIPISGLITILGMLILPLSFVSSYLSVLYGEVLQLLVGITLAISKVASSLPFAMLTIPRPTTFAVLLFIAIVLYFISASSRQRLLSRMVVSLSLILSLILMDVRLVSAVTTDDKLTVMFFDVGQGDAALIHTPGGKNYMIDFGGRSFSGRSQVERNVLPFLRAEGITHVDGAFISHMHYDHYAGLEVLLKDGKVDRIYSCGEKTENLTAYSLDSLTYHRNIPIALLSQGDVISDDDVKLYVLSPKSKSDVTKGEANHRSLILKLVYKNSSFLYLADAERDAEEEIARTYGSFLKSDVVKIAHHGSKTSSTQDIVTVSKPKYAVVSVGEHNSFGHPSTSVLERWYKSGARVLSTAHDGAVIFQSDGDEVSLVNWK